jgi:intracellular sulfur oxidation DsrE/DsrF family protein
MFAFTAMYTQNAFGQVKAEKVVFQLSSGDVEVHKALIRQLGNIKKARPDMVIEVVCHNMGIDFLLTDKTTVADQIRDLVKQNIQFVACENTLKQKNILKSAVLTEAGYVESGLIEVLDRQAQGWGYIKAGF